LPQRQPSERLIVSIYVPTPSGTPRRSRRGAAGIGPTSADLGQTPKVARTDFRREPAIHIQAAFVDSGAASRWDVAQSGGSLSATLISSAERLTSAADARDSVLDVDASPSA